VDPIFVDPGHVSFRIRREGFVSQEKVFDVKAGEEQGADVKLERAPGYDGKTGAGGATGTTGVAEEKPRSKVPGLGLAGGGGGGCGGGGGAGRYRSEQPGGARDQRAEG